MLKRSIVRHKKFTTVFVALLLASLVCLSALSSSQREQSNYFAMEGNDVIGYISQSNPYDTPDEWANRSVAENAASAQIPHELLVTMSSVELVISCLNYPFFVDYYFDNELHGDPFVKMVLPYFNGFSELFSRADGATATLEVYNSINLGNLIESDNYSTLRLDFLLALLRQYEIIDKLTQVEKIQLLQKSSELVRDIEQNWNEHYSPGNIYLLSARVLTTLDENFMQVVRQSQILSNYITMDFSVDVTQEEMEFANDTILYMFDYIRHTYGG
jgi:hypothetical protein